MSIETECFLIQAPFRSDISIALLKELRPNKKGQTYKHLAPTVLFDNADSNRYFGFAATRGERLPARDPAHLHQAPSAKPRWA